MHLNRFEGQVRSLGALAVLRTLSTILWGLFRGLRRLVGAAVLGFAASSWLAYRAAGWERVKIVVQMEIVWTILGALVMLWGLLFASLPAFGWVNAVILAGFAIAFIALYPRS